MMGIRHLLWDLYHRCWSRRPAIAVTGRKGESLTITFAGPFRRPFRMRILDRVERTRAVLHHYALRGTIDQVSHLRHLLGPTSRRHRYWRLTRTLNRQLSLLFYLDSMGDQRGAVRVRARAERTKAKLARL